MGGKTDFIFSGKTENDFLLVFFLLVIVFFVSSYISKYTSRNKTVMSVSLKIKFS